MRVEIRSIVVLLLCVIMAGCAGGFRKQKYTNYRSTVPTYKHARGEDAEDSSVDGAMESDSTRVDSFNTKPNGVMREHEKSPFVVRRIDKIMAYANMLLGVTGVFVLVGVLPAIRGGFSMDRLLKRSYDRGDRTTSIISIVLSLVGVLCFVLLAL